jgi:hypothetical protein
MEQNMTLSQGGRQRSTAWLQNHGDVTAENFLPPSPESIPTTVLSCILWFEQPGW